MTERSRAVLVIVVFVVAAYLGYVFFLRPFIEGQPAVEKVLTERSTWTVTMQEYQLAGPIASETFRVSNDDGKGSMFYSATNRLGTVTKQFNVPLIGPSGTFLFEELRSYGVWELDDKPLRPHPRDEYIVTVAQTLGDEGGSRAFSFSDPVYWATTKAREFQLSLPKKGAHAAAQAYAFGAGGLSLRDRRYLKIVGAIRNFGPQSVSQAEDTIRAELIATPRPARKH